MIEVYDLVTILAPSVRSVLLQGDLKTRLKEDQIMINDQMLATGKCQTAMMLTITHLDLTAILVGC
jgi:uracil phosphoribosyltransferase